MAQLYTEQSRTELPQKSIAGEFMQKSNTAETLEKAGDFFSNLYSQQKATFIDAQTANGKNVINNAYAVYKDNPEKFNETVKNGLDKISKNFTNDQDVVNFYTSMNLVRNPYDVKVGNNFIKKTNDDKVATIRMNFESNKQSFINGASIMIGADNQASKDMKMQMTAMYMGRHQKDAFGENIYTNAQIKEIEELYDNSGYYAIMDFVQDFPDKAEEFKEQLLNNPADFKKKHSITTDGFDKLIDSLDKVSKRIPPKEVIQSQAIIVNNKIDYEKYDFNELGEPENNKFNKFDYINTYLQIEDSSEEYTTIPERKSLSKMQTVLSNKIYDQAYKDGRKGNRDIDDMMFKSFANASGIVDQENPSPIAKKMFTDLYATASKSLYEKGYTKLGGINHKLDKESRKIINDSVKDYLEAKYDEPINENIDLLDPMQSSQLLNMLRQKKTQEFINSIYITPEE